MLPSLPNCEGSDEEAVCPPPTYYCTGCTVTWPETHFPVEELKLNQEMGLVTLHCWRCRLKALHPDTFARHTDLQCKTCKRRGLTLDQFPPSIAREILHVGVRAKHKQGKKGVQALHIACTDCVFPKCWTQCGQRSPAAMLGPLQKRRIWFCNDCVLKEYACSECSGRWPVAVFESNSWSVGDQKQVPKGICFSCHLQMRKPQVWQKWTNLTCSTCSTTGLTLQHFGPSTAKEVCERRGFRWDQQQRSCLSCVQNVGDATMKRCSSSAVQRPCKRLRGDRRELGDGAGAEATLQQTSTNSPAATSPIPDNQTGDPSQVKCRSCQRSWPQKDFHRSRNTLCCWICHWEKAAPEKFALWNALQCQLCKRSQLSLKAFPPRVSNELLGQLRGKRQKQENVKVSCTDCCYPVCWTGCGARATFQYKVFEGQQQHPWFCETCQTSLQTCLKCGAAWNIDRFVADSLCGISQKKNAKPICYTCALVTDKLVYSQWQASRSANNRWDPLSCSKCKRKGLSITDLDPLLAKDILQRRGLRKYRVCRQCASLQSSGWLQAYGLTFMYAWAC